MNHTVNHYNNVCAKVCSFLTSMIHEKLARVFHFSFVVSFWLVLFIFPVTMETIIQYKSTFS